MWMIVGGLHVELVTKIFDHRPNHQRVPVTELVKSAGQKRIPVTDQTNVRKSSDAVGDAIKAWNHRGILLAIINEARAGMTFLQLTRGRDGANNVAHA